VNRRVARLSLFGVALLVGLLLVGQLHSQARPRELSTLSPSELSTLIDTLASRNQQLSSGLGDLNEQLRSYRLGESQGQSTLTLQREDLRRITAFAGLVAVEGQGVVVHVDGSLDAIAVNDLINELRNAAAEAIAVDDVRITARSVAVQGARALQIDGVEIGRSFTMTAIGNPDGLFAALSRPGGIVAQLEQFVSAQITIDQRKAADGTTLRVPATRIDLAPQVATPIQ
jgi:uncharacterized protein YlxW (UPF0749 family)